MTKDGKSVLDPSFQYDQAVEAAKPNYLKEKWDKLYPGWSKKPPKPPKKIDTNTQQAAEIADTPILQLVRRR